MENLVIEMQNKLFICPYFREEGGGQEGYQKFLTFDVFIRGRREGVKANKTNVLIYSLFWMAFINGKNILTQRKKIFWM